MTLPLETLFNAEGKDLNLPNNFICFLSFPSSPSVTDSSHPNSSHLHLKMLLKAMFSYVIPGLSQAYMEVQMLLNFCLWSPINLSFITGLPQPGTQKGRGKDIIFLYTGIGSTIQARCVLDYTTQVSCALCDVCTVKKHSLTMYFGGTHLSH